MCEWGDTVPVSVIVPAAYSSTGRQKRVLKGIDRCIAPLVRALANGGIVTVGSCCGHGKRPGQIILEAGRVFTITGATEGP